MTENNWPTVSADYPCMTCQRSKGDCKRAPDGGAIICWHSSAGEWQGKVRQLSGNRPPAVPIKPAPQRQAKSLQVYPTLEAAVIAAKLSIPGSTPGGLWVYRDAASTPLMAVARFNTSDGSKTCRPLSPVSKGWIRQDPAFPLPLYGLDKLAPVGRVYVVEGEKCADALRLIGLTAVTSAHGANSAAKSDWRPLAGREVVILPDADAAGDNYARSVADILMGLTPSANVRIVDSLPGPDGTAGDARPKGWDIANYLEHRDSDEPHVLAASIEALTDAAEACKSDLDDFPVLERFTPFPVDVLPQAAAAIIRAGAKSIGCDPAYLALPALAALAGAIGNSRHAFVKSGWTEPPTVWALLVGASGTAKTPAAKIILGPLHDRHAKLIATGEEAMKIYRDGMKRYEADLAIWKRKAEGDPPEEPEPPALERAIIEDTTIEALASILRANPRGVLLHRDELAGWIGSFDRYAQNGGGDVARWLSIFSAEPITVDRKSSGTTYVRLPGVSVIGGIQPDRLPVVLTRTLRDTGLLARILMAHAPASPKRFNAADICPDAIAEWQKLQNYITTLDMSADTEGNIQPVYIGFAADAKAEFGKWADAHNAASMGKSGDIASARSKLEAYAVRFALIFAVCEPSAKIERSHIERGCALADWFAAEAERIYDGIGATDGDREIADIIEWIGRQAGPVTLRTITSSCPRKYRGKTADAEAMVQQLVDIKRARWAYDTARPGRPSKRIELIHPGTGSRGGINGSGSETPVDDLINKGIASTASVSIPQQRESA